MTADATETADGDACRASIEPCQWQVIPAGIAQTRFSDPESFHLTVRRIRYEGRVVFVVSANRNSAQVFTRRGKAVFLRHDVNTKWALHGTFEEAANLARDLADGVIVTDDYRTWRHAEAQRFGHEA